MRTLALLVVGVLLVQADVSPKGYESGREYVYEYEGQLLTGLPKTSHEYSGLKIKCRPTFQFHTDTQVVMRLDDISLYRLHNEVEDPTYQQPLEKFQRITGDEADIFERELRKPIRFDYRQGKVSDLETSRDDPIWSVNSKRGITDLVQLNLDERDSLDQDRNVNRHSTEGRAGDVKLLRVKEEGLFGKCESLYQIKFDEAEIKQSQNSRELEPMPLMNITKVRNLENCDDRRMMQKSILSGMRMDQDKKQQEEPLIKSLREIRYNISGNQQEFVIESIVSEGQHIFTPYHDKVSNVVTFVNQTMKLLRQESISTRIEMPSETIKERTLCYEFPELKQMREKTWEQIQQDEERMEPAELRNLRKEDVRELLNWLVSSLNWEFIGEEVPARFAYMVQKMRDLKKEDIQEIYNEACKSDRSQETKDEERKRKLMWDALPLINTREAIKFIKEKIERREIEGEEANQMLNTIALIHDPTIKTLDDVLALCKDAKVVEQKEVRKTCWLCFGTLVNSAFGKDKHSKVQMQMHEIMDQVKQERTKVMTPERRQRIDDMERRLNDAREEAEDAKKRYTKNLIDGIKPQQPREEQMMCLRAIGNSALVDTIQEVQSIIESVHTYDDLKVRAIYALRRIAPQVPSKVRNILATVYHNQEYSPEIRIAAYAVIMDSNITLPVMQLFAQSLHKERDQQVGSFVYSHLKSLCNSTNPMEKKKTEWARYAIRFAKPIKPGAQYSKNVRLTKQMENLDMGITTEMNTVGTQKSLLPRSGNAKVQANILGYNMHVLEAGFRAEGLRNIVDKIFGPEGSLWRKNSMLDLLKRKPRSVSTVEKERKQLRDSLPVEPRKPEELKGSLYVKVFGNELRFWTFDKDTFKSILDEGVISIKDIEQKLKEKRSVELQKAIMLAEVTQQIPTELGFPLQVNVSSAAFVNLKVEGRARVEPALFESDRQGQKPEAIIADLDVYNRIALNIEGKVGVDAYILRCGVGVNATVNSTVPFNSMIHFNLKNQKYETLFKTLETERQFVSIKSKPYTFAITKKEKTSNQDRDVDFWDSVWSSYDSTTDKSTKTPVWKELRHDRVIEGKLIQRQPTLKQWKYGKEEFGIEVEVSTKHVSRKNVPAAPVQPLSGPIEVNITARPGDNRPTDIEVELTVQDKNVQQSEEHLELHNTRQFINVDKSKSWSKSESVEDQRRSSEDTTSWEIKKDDWDFKSASFEDKERRDWERRDWEHRGQRPEGQSSEQRDIEHRVNEVIPVKKFVLRITGKRDNVDEKREMMAELTVDSHDETYKGFHVELTRTPIKDREQQPWRMCMQAEAEYPRETIDTVEKLIKYLEDARKEPRSSEEEYTYFGGKSSKPSRPVSQSRSSEETSSEERKMKDQKNEQIRAKLNVQWGESCENDKKVEIKTRVSKTRDQMRKEREQTAPEFEQCKKDKRNNKPYSPACNELLKKVSELRQIDTEITHQKLTKWEKNAYSKAMLMAEYYLWDNLKVDNVEIDNPYHKVLITAKLSENKQELNFTVNHPFENLKFENVRLPVKVQPFSTRKSMVDQYMNLYMNEQYTPFCKVRGNEIRTFDNVTYKYDLTKCDHILAKDCSEEERFTVLTSKKHHDSDKKITKMFVDDKKVEVIPDDTTDNMIVRVDSVPQELKVGEKMTIRKNGHAKIESLDKDQPRRMHDIVRPDQRRSSSSSSSSSSEEREISRQECQELRRKSYRTASEEDRLRECERSSSSEEREISRQECQELRRKNFLTASEEDRLRECVRRSSSEEREISRQECQELRRKSYRTASEEDRLRECERSSSSEEREVSREECQELRRKVESHSQLTSEESRKVSICREMKSKSQSQSQSDSLSRETYEDNRSKYVQTSDKERRHWRDFERRISQEVSREQSAETPEEQEDRTNPVELIVIRHHDNRVEIISTKYGLKMKTDGKNAKVELSSFYRGKQCGLCGNFDGEKKDEFEGPKNEVYRDPQQFGISYQVPSAKCSERSECIPRMRNVIENRRIDGVDMTCFSKTPVSQCIVDKGCRPQETREERLDYHCLESDQKSTRDLVELSKTGVVNKVSRKRTTFSDNAEVHTSCRKY